MVLKSKTFNLYLIFSTQRTENDMNPNLPPNHLNQFCRLRGMGIVLMRYLDSKQTDFVDVDIHVDICNCGIF